MHEKFQRFYCYRQKYQNVEKWLNFQIFQLKWKIVKHFTSSNSEPPLRELFSLSKPDKMLLRLWKKNFLRWYAEIYRHLLSKSFKNMQFLGMKNWCSANIFSDIKQKNVGWKICKVRKVFGCVARAYYFQYQVSWGS